jgi:hypothetical protein
LGFLPRQVPEQVAASAALPYQTGSSPGGVGYNEAWSFTLLSGMLRGDVTNLDLTYYLGLNSDNGAFSLQKR